MCEICVRSFSQKRKKETNFRVNWNSFDVLSKFIVVDVLARPLYCKHYHREKLNRHTHTHLLLVNKTFNMAKETKLTLYSAHFAHLSWFEAIHRSHYLLFQLRKYFSSFHVRSGFVCFWCCVHTLDAMSKYLFCIFFSFRFIGTLIHYYTSAHKCVCVCVVHAVRLTTHYKYTNIN